MNQNKRIKDVKKIILTGGHAATTAISVIEEIIRRDNQDSLKKWDIVWIGTQKAIEGKKISTLEHDIFPKMGVRNYSIQAGRIQRKFTIWTIPSLMKLPLGVFQAFKIVRNLQPDIILSFGGFVAFPVVLSAYLLKIPILLHEQTGHIGRANRFSLFFAEKIALSRKSKYIKAPEEKIVITGNPVMTQVAEIKTKKEIGDPPILFVAGGSRGSQSLNNIVLQAIEKLLENYYVIHLTGPVDFEKINQAKDKMNSYQKQRYEIYARIDPMQIDGVYKRADIIFARSGANTVSEIMCVKRPAILVPLPISHIGDQYFNAKRAERYGIAKVINQDILTSDLLLEEINNLRDNWKKIVEKVALKKSPDVGASARVVDLLESLVK